MKIKRVLSGIASVGLLSSLGIVATSTPASAGAWEGDVCASRYGNKIQYDTNKNDGYQWKTLSKGKCREDDSNDAYRAVGAKSIVLITNLDAYRCFNTGGPTTIEFPSSVSKVYIEGFPKKDCKR